MICCKIISDFSNDFSVTMNLLEKLSTLGEFLWDNGNLFFADTSENVDEAKIMKVMKKAGFKKGYINVYTKTNPPHESDYVNGWLTDRLIKINYVQCEQTSQELFHDISKGLDIIDEEIRRISESEEKTED